jgi:hypothetical protein
LYSILSGPKILDSDLSKKVRVVTPIPTAIRRAGSNTSKKIVRLLFKYRSMRFFTTAVRLLVNESLVFDFAREKRTAFSLRSAIPWRC